MNIYTRDERVVQTTAADRTHPETLETARS
jgi:hypothetical protein